MVVDVNGDAIMMVTKCLVVLVHHGKIGLLGGRIP